MDQARWQKFIDWPLLIAAVVFLVAYSWKVIGDLHGEDLIVASVLIVTTWGVFLLDYVANLALAPDRGHWFRTHIFDLFVVLLPVLRPLRLLRLVSEMHLFQRSPGDAVRARAGIYMAGASVLLIYMVTLAVLDVERSSPDANITSFGDALWWAVVTVGTVGYGDFTPVTVLGRILATALMLGGIAILGVTTATFASWIVERVEKVTR